MMPFWELTESQRACRLDRAIHLSQESSGYGIGVQKERTVHSVLKFYLEPDVDQHEIPIGSFIADIYHHHPQEALEIQSAGFGALRRKLDCFLAEFPVTVIYPVPWHKWLFWSDPESGEVSSGRRSPKTGELYWILPELYRIRSYLSHPRLSFLPVLVDVEEYRLLNGWSRDRKRGSHRMDRIPVQIGPCRLLQTPQDYVEILPPLPRPFTSADFQKATRFSPRAASYALLALRSLGALIQCGCEGRAYLYQTISNPEEETTHAI